MNADDAQKPDYYRLVEKASKECHAAARVYLIRNESAAATSNAAMIIVLERVWLRKADRIDEFVTEAYATIGIAYHRAAGTAAVDPLTMTASYTKGQND